MSVVGIITNSSNIIELEKKLNIIVINEKSIENTCNIIKEKYNSELYHIPMMIYDKKLTDKYVSENGTNKIEKFTTTSDIVPTVLDIFGLDGWKNLYFGSTIFNHESESIVFSRNYGIFISDNFVGYSLNSLKYKSKDFTKEDKKDYEDGVEYTKNDNTYPQVFWLTINKNLYHTWYDSY